MKKLVLATCFTLALATLGPVSSAATTGWPFHRHHKDAAPKTPKPAKAKSEKSRKSLFHHEKSNDKAREQSARAEVAAGVSPGPKSVGWRHQTPGPAGAGAR
jgi:hypothetical protein